MRKKIDAFENRNVLNSDNDLLTHCNYYLIYCYDYHFRNFIQMNGPLNDNMWKRYIFNAVKVTASVWD